MIAADEARQIEGLAGGIESTDPVPGIVTDGLGGGVVIGAEDDVRPDLIGDDVYIILSEQLHGFFQLPFLPDSSAGVVGIAENGGVDVLLLQAALHVRKVHAPDICLVFYQGRVDDLIAVVFQAMGKANVGGAVEEHLVTPGADAVQGAVNAAENPVFIADVLFGKALNAVAGALPADDGIVVFRCWVKIAEGRVLCPGDNRLLNGGAGGEIHVRDPHGNHVEARLGCPRCTGAADTVYGNGILPVAVHERGKVVLHWNHLSVSRVVDGSIVRPFAPFCKSKREFSPCIRGCFEL